MTRITCSIASAALLAAVFLSPAFATDRKVYSGASCKPAIANAGNVDYPLGPKYGIRNNNGYTVPIICPLIHDSIDNTKGIADVGVTWTAKFSSDRIVCALKFVSSTGDVRAVKFLELFGTGYTWAGGFNAPSPIASDDKFGSYVLDCQLPPLGILHTISIEEHE